jgi:hypothetical protein
VTGDMRAAIARAYLASVRQHRVTMLPPSVMVRELAETRRQLGIVLDVIEHQAPALTEAQRASVLDALAVAAENRVYRASLTCDACGTHPAELCDDHQADLDAAEQYHAIAAQIGGE